MNGVRKGDMGLKPRRKDRLTTPRKRLPKCAKWAIEDTIALAQQGEDLCFALHQSSNDPNLMHKLLEIKVCFNKIENIIGTIGVEKEA